MAEIILESITLKLHILSQEIISIIYSFGNDTYSVKFKKNGKIKSKVKLTKEYKNYQYMLRKFFMKLNKNKSMNPLITTFTYGPFTYSIKNNQPSIMVTILPPPIKPPVITIT